MSRKVLDAIARLPAVPGLSPLSDGTGYQLDLYQVEASQNVFVASGFKTTVQQDQFMMLFGSSSPFEAETGKFDLAVELYLPRTGLEHLVRSVAIDESAVGDERFIDTMDRILTPSDKQWAKDYTCTLDLPADRVHALRAFPAHAVGATLWDYRGYLEFLTLPTSLVRAKPGATRTRKGDSVRSLLFVLLDSRLLYAFLLRAMATLESLKEFRAEES